MSTVGDQLQTIRTNLLSAIVDATTNPKPNYKIDGQEVAHGDYLKTLLDSLSQIEAKIRQFGDGDGQTFEYQTILEPC